MENRYIKDDMRILLQVRFHGVYHGQKEVDSRLSLDTDTAHVLRKKSRYPWYLMQYCRAQTPYATLYALHIVHICIQPPRILFHACAATPLIVLGSSSTTSYTLNSPQ